MYLVSINDSPVRHWLNSVTETNKTTKHYRDPFDATGFLVSESRTFDVHARCGVRVREATTAEVYDWNAGWDPTCGNCQRREPWTDQK